MFPSCDFSYTCDQGKAKGYQDREEEDGHCRVPRPFQVHARLYLVQRNEGREGRHEAQSSHRASQRRT